MSKLNKALSIVLSTAVGLSFHASSFKSFGMDNIVPKSNKEAREKNILDRNDLKNFKGKKLYRTSMNILINDNITPINKHGNEVTNENFISVPKILFSYVPLHPIINFISEYDDKKTYSVF